MAPNEFDLTPHLPLVASGKVRELYKIDADTLLFVASDRISAFDVILNTSIPKKGKILTVLSEHWFSVLSKAVPTLKHHFITKALPPQIPQELASRFQDRCMQVRKLRVLPIEAIVRGYITGSAWSEYRKSGTVHGTLMPEGLQESQAFPEPLYTPSTKAEQGAHDENISQEQAAEIIGDKEIAEKVASLAVNLYKVARDEASKRGIIIADTKFEFGVDEAGEVYLIDEVLTPDSSRFWPQAQYKVGQAQKSFDKQPLRDWLTKSGLKGKDDTDLPEEVVRETATKYEEAFELLTGQKFSDA